MKIVLLYYNTALFDSIWSSSSPLGGVFKSCGLFFPLIEMNKLEEVHWLLSESVRKTHDSFNERLPEVCLLFSYNWQCFDRRPISLMLVPNSDQFERNKLIKITNVWRSDWLKDGVQVSSGNNSDPSASPKFVFYCLFI